MKKHPPTRPAYPPAFLRNASSAGPSMAEVAYSLLLDGDVTPEGMEYTDKAEEFADQCKAITMQLENQQNRCSIMEIDSVRARVFMYDVCMHACMHAVSSH